MLTPGAHGSRRWWEPGSALKAATGQGWRHWSSSSLSSTVARAVSWEEPSAKCSGFGESSNCSHSDRSPASGSTSDNLPSPGMVTALTTLTVGDRVPHAKQRNRTGCAIGMLGARKSGNATAKEHALVKAEVLQAGEGRQLRHEGALCRPRLTQHFAQRLQVSVTAQMCRCCLVGRVLQHLQLGTCAHCMHAQVGRLTGLGQ